MSHEIYIIPWIRLRTPLVIGEFILWPWNNRYRRTSLLPNVAVRAVAAKAVRAFKPPHVSGVKTAAVLSRRTGGTVPFTAEESANARRAVSVLAYGFLISNWDHLARTAENFALVSRSFPDPGAHGTAFGVTYITGTIVQQTNLVPVDENRTYQPTSLPAHADSSIRPPL